MIPLWTLNCGGDDSALGLLGAFFWGLIDVSTGENPTEAQCLKMCTQQRRSAAQRFIWHEKIRGILDFLFLFYLYRYHGSFILILMIIVLFYGSIKIQSSSVLFQAESIEYRPMNRMCMRPVIDRHVVIIRLCFNPFQMCIIYALRQLIQLIIPAVFGYKRHIIAPLTTNITNTVGSRENS